MRLLHWLSGITYGWLWIDEELERAKLRAKADYWHPVAIRERQTDEAIYQYLMSWASRQAAQHRFEMISCRCMDCGVTVIENASVPHGYGVPCRGES